MVSTIPILDFSVASLEYSDDEYIQNDLNTLANEVVSIFTSVGFFYIRNHGVSDEDIEKFHKYTHTFFNLPENIKQKYLRDETNNGWSPLEREKVNMDRPADLKESFNVTNIKEDIKVWPTEVPQFQGIMTKFFKMMASISMRLLRLIAIGLKLEDPNYFHQFHCNVGGDNLSTMRSLRYPSLVGKEIKHNQIRCGEHTDFGTITVLFQDEIGGLEVLNKNDDYIPVGPIPGCAVVNIGDLMQKWTDNRLRATMHRVVPPSNDQMQSGERRSLAFFLYPDYSATIKSPLNDDDEPVNAREYSEMKFGQTYGYK